MKSAYNPEADFTSEILPYNAERRQTDLLVYRERAPLLIPPEGERTTFTIISDDDKLRYFISSTLETGLRELETFFSGISECYFERCELPAFRSERDFLLLPRLGNFRGNRKYTSAFLRTLTSVPLALGVNVMLQVVVSSYTLRNGLKKYGFWLEVCLKDKQEHHQQIVDLVRTNINSMVEDNGIALKLVEGREKFRIQRNMFSDPFELANFIRLLETEYTESDDSLAYKETEEETG